MKEIRTFRYQTKIRRLLEEVEMAKINSIFSQNDKSESPIYQNDTFNQKKGSDNKIGTQESAKLTPIKGSKGNLAVPGIFINNSEAGHTSSHRSLYSYGSRNNDIISTPQVEIETPHVQIKLSSEIQSEEFSGFLSSAALHKPSFLDKTKKIKHIESDYETNYKRQSNAPELPPRDYPNELQPNKSNDFDYADERRRDDDFVSKSEKLKSEAPSLPARDSHYDMNLLLEEAKGRREGDREERISVLDDVDEDDY